MLGDRGFKTNFKSSTLVTKVVEDSALYTQQHSQRRTFACTDSFKNFAGDRFFIVVVVE